MSSDLPRFDSPRLMCVGSFGLADCCELVSRLVVPSRLFALDIRKRTRVEKKVSIAERPLLSNRDIPTIVSKQP
jgi:hypothetical protein